MQFPGIRLVLTAFWFTGWLTASPSFGAPIPVPVTSTFDSDCDGWTGNMTGLCDEDGTPSVGMSWITAGTLQFNEGLAVEALDTTIVAPEKFLGDWSALDGVGSIQYDHMVVNSGSNIGNAPREIYLSGGGSSATWSGPLVPAGNFLSTGWMTFIAPLNESDWIVMGSWGNLLSNVESFEIRVDHYTSFVGSAETHRFDNVTLMGRGDTQVPEPMSLILLCTGLAGVAYRRWRQT